MLEQNANNAPALIVHGGAWRIAVSEHAAHVNGCRAAVEAVWDALKDGMSAMEAVKQAVIVLEDDPTFDAGRGSVLNCVGEVELDAILMDGDTLRVGAVGGVQGIQNPIALAQIILEHSEHSLLVSDGAQDFARLHGVRFVPQSQLTVQREVDRFTEYQNNPPSLIAEAFMAAHSGGTVGAVARDVNGNIAAATSTGGTPYSLPGRVGDSPLAGCGTYADNETGGASATGHGERILEVALTKHATERIRGGLNASGAAQEAIDYMQRRVGGYGGIIMIDKDGNIGFAHNTPHMAVAWVSDDDIHTYIQPDTKN